MYDNFSSFKRNKIKIEILEKPVNYTRSKTIFETQKNDYTKMFET